MFKTVCKVMSKETGKKWKNEKEHSFNENKVNTIKLMEIWTSYVVI